MQTEFCTTDPADAPYVKIIKELIDLEGGKDIVSEPIAGRNGRPSGRKYILTLIDADFVHFVAGLDAGPDCD